MPVLVDSDRETFLMDPGKPEALIIPLHIGGAAAHMVSIFAIAKNAYISNFRNSARLGRGVAEHAPENRQVIALRVPRYAICPERQG